SFDIVCFREKVFSQLFSLGELLLIEPKTDLGRFDLRRVPCTKLVDGELRFFNTGFQLGDNLTGLDDRTTVNQHTGQQSGDRTSELHDALGLDDAARCNVCIVGLLCESRRYNTERAYQSA